ncbi:hypothetical protein BV22DRAFT_272575 [Leucogyrophana mollusca]|uniref:Uncharacterized protein n=1 Tax=Leucogyrophana mollusca TaxID=85980 RepID=A0ACB8BSF7_9AGAM|nr:hypothetical protein BV22DRAFT_272575 [Leucogyrophana mollusca]
MHSLAIIVLAALTTSSFARNKCAYRSTPHFGQWAVDIYSETDCNGDHKYFNGTQKIDSCVCTNLGDFDCHVVSSFVFSSSAHQYEDHIIQPDIKFYKNRDCKGAVFGYSDKEWIRQDVDLEHRETAAFKVCVEEPSK